jgi:hypothetical protein
VDPPQDTSLLTAGYLRGPPLSLQVLHPLMCFSIGTTGKMKRDGSSTHPLSPVPLSPSPVVSSPDRGRPKRLRAQTRPSSPLRRRRRDVAPGPDTIHSHAPRAAIGCSCSSFWGRWMRSSRGLAAQRRPAPVRAQWARAGDPRSRRFHCQPAGNKFTALHGRSKMRPYPSGVSGHSRRRLKMFSPDR